MKYLTLSLAALLGLAATAEAFVRRPPIIRPPVVVRPPIIRPPIYRPPIVRPVIVQPQYNYGFKALRFRQSFYTQPFSYGYTAPLNLGYGYSAPAFTLPQVGCYGTQAIGVCPPQYTLPQTGCYSAPAFSLPIGGCAPAFSYGAAFNYGYRPPLRFRSSFGY